MSHNVINKSNKYAKCNAIYDSKVDLSLSKTYELQNHWIGCDGVDQSACDYWAQVRCADITVKKSKTKRKKYEIITPLVKCPKHSKTLKIYILLIKYTLYMYIYLKLVSAVFYQIFIFSQNDSPFKTMKNVFYFI